MLEIVQMVEHKPRVSKATYPLVLGISYYTLALLDVALLLYSAQPLLVSQAPASNTEQWATCVSPT